MVDENHEFYTYIIDKIPAIKLSEWTLSMSAEVVEGIHSNPLFALCDGEVLILAILMEIVSSFMDEAAIFHRIVRLHGILFLYGLRISKDPFDSTDYVLRQGQ